MVELAIRVVLSLAVVLGLFWMVARTGSKRMRGRDRKLVTVRSRQALSRGSSLAVVEIGSRVLVVGVSDGGIRLLTELDPQELEAREAVPAPAFVQTSYPSLRTPSRPFRRAAAPRPEPVREAPAAVEEPSFAAVLADEASYVPTYEPALAPAHEPTYDLTYDLAYDLAPEQEVEDAYEPARAAVPTRSSGGLGGSLLDGAVWRDAWASATGRSHRGDAA